VREDIDELLRSEGLAVTARSDDDRLQALLSLCHSTQVSIVDVNVCKIKAHVNIQEGHPACKKTEFSCLHQHLLFISM